MNLKTGNKTLFRGYFEKFASCKHKICMVVEGCHFNFIISPLAFFMFYFIPLKNK